MEAEEEEAEEDPEVEVEVLTPGYTIATLIATEAQRNEEPLPPAPKAWP